MFRRPPPPCVLIPACRRELAGRGFHATPMEYAEAVRLAGCRPLMVPGIAPRELDQLLDLADGVLLPGSPSNVHPSHFGEKALDPALPHDPERDELTLPLVRAAVKRGIPLLGICRGFQEMNVAFGGSLHQALHRLPGTGSHFHDVEPLAERYGPVHEVGLAPGGLLEHFAGTARVMVNSVHGQGIDRLGEGWRVEALAPDGIIEAIVRPASPGFVLGVQWHPEWQAARNPFSMAILRAFGTACRGHADARLVRMA